MRKYIISLLILVGVLSLPSCNASLDRNEFHLHIPVSGIHLNEPVNDAVIDLDNPEIDSYEFSWAEMTEGKVTLILSLAKDLTNPVNIDAGFSSPFTMSVNDANRYFTQLGIKAGEKASIYWTVKENSNLTAAASQVNLINAHRMSSKLITPEDMTPIALDRDKPEEMVNFAWNREGFEENEKFKLCLSVDPMMKNNVAKESIVLSNGVYSMSYQVLNDMLTKLDIRHYAVNPVYWNIESSKGELVSRSSGVLNMTEMMSFKDVRGDESITYKVVRLNYPNGKSVVWLAENLRSLKYPNGADIETSNFMNTPASLGEDRVKAYGVHYKWDIREKVIPEGWKLPSKDDYKVLFEQAGAAEGAWNVLKDPDFYPSVAGGEHLNEWGLGLTASGQWNGTSVNNHSSQYFYFLTSDGDKNKCGLHDGGSTLWWPWTTGAPIRMIYKE